ncbi:hypothetical protein [Mycoplasma sp. 2248]|uniref:hypothetical protein n=1 Tax=Mycoplasma sp. 2248 TaxID=3108528 RepID=UPI002B1D2769|nr:hypothetical protein [Mycoplasma sp. 2248]MEA4191249.1 hypothetical protein [Mycoplasma sp. 2248]
MENNKTINYTFHKGFSYCEGVVYVKEVGQLITKTTQSGFEVKELYVDVLYADKFHSENYRPTPASAKLKFTGKQAEQASKEIQVGHFLNFYGSVLANDFNNEHTNHIFNTFMYLIYHYQILNKYVSEVIAYHIADAYKAVQGTFIFVNASVELLTDEIRTEKNFVYCKAAIPLKDNQKKFLTLIKTLKVRHPAMMDGAVPPIYESPYLNKKGSRAFVKFVPLVQKNLSKDEKTTYYQVYGSYEELSMVEEPQEKPTETKPKHESCFEFVEEK